MIKALSAFLNIRPAAPGPLFCHVNRKPVSRYQFASVLSTCVRKAGYAGSNIKTHSFRMGRATDLAAKSVPAADIMKLGRWSSGAYKLYIR